MIRKAKNKAQKFRKIFHSALQWPQGRVVQAQKWQIAQEAAAQLRIVMPQNVKQENANRQHVKVEIVIRQLVTEGNVTRQNAKQIAAELQPL